MVRSVVTTVDRRRLVLFKQRSIGVVTPLFRNHNEKLHYVNRLKKEMEENGRNYDYIMQLFHKYLINT